jgi:hypothetical protein
VPSSLHSQGALAGAGSAVSLVAAALVSLLFATGLVAFTSWPVGSKASTPSVTVPSAPVADGTPRGASAGAAALAGSAIVLPGAGAPAHRRAARTVARTGTRGGSTANASTPAPIAAPASNTAPSTDQSPPPAVTRSVTDSVADATANTTDQVGSAVGGPGGAAIQTTGEQVAQTVRDIGGAVQPVLGG